MDLERITCKDGEQYCKRHTYICMNKYRSKSILSSKAIEIFFKNQILHDRDCIFMRMS